MAARVSGTYFYVTARSIYAPFDGTGKALFDCTGSIPELIENIRTTGFAGIEPAPIIYVVPVSVYCGSDNANINAVPVPIIQSIFKCS